MKERNKKEKPDIVNSIKECEFKELYVDTEFGKMFVKVFNNNQYHDLNQKNINQDTIVFLHGFGMNHNTFDNIIKRFNNYNVISLDFLGFGLSDKPNTPMTLDDYANTLYKVIIYVYKNCFANIDISNSKLYLVGHSFGGRVGLLYSYKYHVDKLFLINGKALKNKKMSYKLKILKYKIRKAFIFNKNKYFEFVNKHSSNDYKSVNGVMKKTFVNVVNFDLENKLSKIKNEVIIMASVNDDVVRFEESMKIYNMTKKSIIYPFYNSKHFSYLDEEDKVVNIINKHLEER